MTRSAEIVLARRRWPILTYINVEILLLRCLRYNECNYAQSASFVRYNVAAVCALDGCLRRRV